MNDWRSIIAAHRAKPRRTPRPEKRPLLFLTCERCSAPFQSKRRKRFCSRPCGQRARSSRKRQEHKAARQAALAASRSALPKGYYELRRERLIAIRRSRRDYKEKHNV